MDLREVLPALWQRKYVIIAVTSFFFIMGIIYALVFYKPSYKAVTRISLYPYNITAEALLERICPEDVLNQSLKEIAGGNTSYEAGSLRISAIPDTDLLEISFSSSDPELAAEVASQAGKFLLEKARQYRLNELNMEIHSQKALLKLLKNEMKSLAGTHPPFIVKNKFNEMVIVTSQGESIYLVELNPVYRILLLEEAITRLALKRAEIELSQLEHSDDLHTAFWHYPGQIPALTVWNGYYLYPVLGLFFGFIFSITAIVICGLQKECISAGSRG